MPKSVKCLACMPSAVDVSCPEYIHDGLLSDLLAGRYDSVAAHSWRKHGVSGDAYAKLEEIFRTYVKNEQAV